MITICNIRFVRRIKHAIAAATVMVAMIVGGAPTFADEVDARFDGRWVGREIFQYGNGGGMPGSYAVQAHETFTTIIGIADHGKTLGVTKGWAKGRYEVVPEKSGGNKLEFQMPGTNGDKLIFVGRQHCTLTLSADGNTIKEAGGAIMGIDHHTGHGFKVMLWGTFQREGHY